MSTITLLRKVGTSIIMLSVFVLCMFINKMFLEAWIVDAIPFWMTIFMFPVFLVASQVLVIVYDTWAGKVN